MKSIYILTLLLTMLLAGCAQHYVITLTNGNRITTNGKPQRSGESYYFTDFKGQAGSVPVGRVREVAPASMAGSPFSTGNDGSSGK